MKKTLLKKAAVAALVMTSACAAFAEDGRSIIQKVLDVKKPDFNHSMVKMDLIEKNGSVEESRIIEEFGRHNKNTDTSDLVIIFKNSTNKSNINIRFLQMENKGKDDDKWIYMPALRTTRRVNSSEGDKSFTGTDASYDDMATRELDDDTHELLGEETKNGFDCWKIKSIPTDKTMPKAQYKYRLQWIDKKTYVPVYAEMYDKKSGELEKVLTVEKLENINGYDIPTSNLLTNVQTGHATRIAALQNKDGKYAIILDKQIPDSVFTQNFLNTGK
ncbi:MAG: outer membrane lipoprotein-sorting protein [Treponema sp.]|nr:outer membrane lipoprotein-sorting protein [Treponema sp.]